MSQTPTIAPTSTVADLDIALAKARAAAIIRDDKLENLRDARKKYAVFAEAYTAAPDSSTRTQIFNNNQKVLDDLQAANSAYLDANDAANKLIEHAAKIEAGLT